LIDQFSFVTPIMLKGAPNWGVRTGFFFGCTGFIVVVIAWFIVPETARVSCLCPCSFTDTD
jgi:hypothetical protein